MRFYPHLFLSLAGAWALTGCAPPPQTVAYIPPSPRVTFVETYTPGVAYFLVRPSPEPHVRADGRLPREYILLCDARPVDGMHCDVPQEAALSRISEHPRVGPAKNPIDLMIGGLERHKKDDEKKDDEKKDEKKEPGNAGSPSTTAPSTTPPTTTTTTTEKK